MIPGFHSNSRHTPFEISRSHCDAQPETFFTESYSTFLLSRVPVFRLNHFYARLARFTSGHASRVLCRLFFFFFEGRAAEKSTGDDAALHSFTFKSSLRERFKHLLVITRATVCLSISSVATSSRHLE